DGAGGRGYDLKWMAWKPLETVTFALSPRYTSINGGVKEKRQRGIYPTFDHAWRKMTWNLQLSLGAPTPSGHESAPFPADRWHLHRREWHRTRRGRRERGPKRACYQPASAALARLQSAGEIH